MNARVEIEITTTFRDALAEKLVKHAARFGKTPVDFMADFVVRGLHNLGREEHRQEQRKMAALEIRELRRELMRLRLEVTSHRRTA